MVECSVWSFVCYVCSGSIPVIIRKLICVVLECIPIGYYNEIAVLLYALYLYVVRVCFLFILYFF